jgi:hypothetical protein
MRPANETKDNGRLEKLRKREAALKAAIAVEQVRRQKAEAKLEAREFAVVGEALCRYAGESVEFHKMISQVLQTVVTDEVLRRFLSGRGWF